MKTHLSVFAMTAILIVGIGTAPAFGQIVAGAIDVSTDKESYTTGDTIVVSGTIRDDLGTDITMRIIAPNGNVVAVQQITPKVDKTYETEVVIGGIFKFTGEYTVRVTYASENRVAASMFNVEVKAMEEPTVPVVDIETWEIEGTDDLIQYSITGGTVKSIVPDPESMSLRIMIEATDDGTLTITIPRTILEADEKGVFILVDDEEMNDFGIDTTDEYRKITIDFPQGTEMIVIIGTWVIPEFGVIAAMILAIAIISVIAISARSRLSIIPRY